jgi:hypothetical protein
MTHFKHQNSPVMSIPLQITAIKSIVSSSSPRSPPTGGGCYYTHIALLFPQVLLIVLLSSHRLTLFAGFTMAFYKAGGKNNRYLLQEERKRLTTTTSPLNIHHPQPPLNIHHPHNAVFVNHGTMRQAVYNIDDQNKKSNTKIAYTPKEAEFFQYCNHRWKNNFNALTTLYTVTFIKVHEFIFYQSMRGCRKRGGKKRKAGMETVDDAFDGVEFDDIMNKHKFSAASAPWPEPERPLGYDQVNTYKASLRNLHDRQVADNINNIPWENIWNADLKLLMTMVKKRKARIKKNNYGEKVDHEFAPYTAADEVPNIEHEMWKRGYGGSYRSAFAWLRNRYCLLQTYSGILRCESLFNAELSDMLGLTMQKKHDPHQLYLLIMQMATGEKIRVFVCFCYTFNLPFTCFCYR